MRILKIYKNLAFLQSDITVRQVSIMNVCSYYVDHRFLANMLSPDTQQINSGHLIPEKPT